MTKAYIFTIDFIISFFIIILLLGILLNHLEVIQIDTRHTLQDNAREIAITSSEILIMNPNWTCFVASGNYYIPNCIDTTLLTPGQNLKSILAIPEYYNYDLNIDNTLYGADSSTYENNPCFTIKRQIALNKTTEDSWPTTKTFLILRIWEADI